jgi:hypothetical protein
MKLVNKVFSTIGTTIPDFFWFHIISKYEEMNISLISLTASL